MIKRVFIINGPAGSGKDTFVSMVSSIVPSVNHSSVELVKEAAKILGWKGEKTDKDRKFLADLKFLSSEYSAENRRWMVKKYIDFFEDNIHQFLFFHIREIDEIRVMRELLDAQTILIIRDGVSPNLSNAADANVLDYGYDFTINNSGSLGDLKIKAQEFIDSILPEGTIDEIKE